MLKLIRSNQFKRDLKLAKKQNLDLSELGKVVTMLANQVQLDAKYKDHSLTGNYAGYRECHIKPNWLLIYRIDKDELMLFLFRTGTHSNLFKK